MVIRKSFYCLAAYLVVALVASYPNPSFAVNPDSEALTWEQYIAEKQNSLREAEPLFILGQSFDYQGEQVRFIKNATTNPSIISSSSNQLNESSSISPSNSNHNNPKFQVVNGANHRFYVQKNQSVASPFSAQSQNTLQTLDTCGYCEIVFDGSDYGSFSGYFVIEFADDASFEQNQQNAQKIADLYGLDLAFTFYSGQASLYLEDKSRAFEVLSLLKTHPDIQNANLALDFSNGYRSF